MTTEAKLKLCASIWRIERRDKGRSWQVATDSVWRVSSATSDNAMMQQAALRADFGTSG